MPEKEIIKGNPQLVSDPVVRQWYEAKRYNLTLSDDVQMTTQERAYTSPIWYTP